MSALYIEFSLCFCVFVRPFAPIKISGLPACLLSAGRLKTDYKIEKRAGKQARLPHAILQTCAATWFNSLAVSSLTVAATLPYRIALYLFYSSKPTPPSGSAFTGGAYHNDTLFRILPGRGVLTVHRIALGYASLDCRGGL
jgi:hypothetical protein